MKLTIILGTSLLLLLMACGKNTISSPEIKITYPNLTGDNSLRAIRTDRNDLTLIIDTVDLAILNEDNAYSYELYFQEGPPNHILFVEGTTHIDTISQVYFIKKGPSNKIKDFEYKFNGESRKDTEISIP